MQGHGGLVYISISGNITLYTAEYDGRQANAPQGGKKKKILLDHPDKFKREGSPFIRVHLYPSMFINFTYVNDLQPKPSLLSFCHACVGEREREEAW